MTGFYDFFLHVLSTMPVAVQAILLGWAVSITITQPLKFAMPLRWRPATRARIARIVAFLTAFLTCLIWDPVPFGAVLGFMVGVWSPGIYWLGMKIVNRQWPWLSDVMSGDVRGILIGKKDV